MAFIKNLVDEYKLIKLSIGKLDKEDFDIKTEKLTTLSFQHPIVVFDGECVLCDRSINFLIKKDTKKKLRYTTLQAVRPGVSSYDSVILYLNGEVYEKAAVWGQLIPILGGAWWFFKPFMFIPISWLNKLYDFIARNRYRWFGKNDHCRIPSAEEKELFI
jgi:predicted DCC family thiol-disulfide oxidoreductase YuxK